MYSISYDPASNHITVVISSMPYGDELQKYGERLVAAIESARPGFRILVDMTRARTKVISNSDIEGAKQLMEYATQKGMSKFAYVVSSITLKLQLIRSLKGTGHEDSIFEDMDKAKEFLA